MIVPAAITAMPIDRNARARLGARLRADRRLTPSTRLVAHAALFAATDTRTGRCQAYRARLAHEGGCSQRTVTRATAQLAELGYLTIAPTYGPRHRQIAGRWFRPRGANVLIWRLPPEFFLRDSLSRHPSPLTRMQPPSPLPEGLAKVLERFGNAIADEKQRHTPAQD